MAKHIRKVFLTVLTLAVVLSAAVLLNTKAYATEEGEKVTVTLHASSQEGDIAEPIRIEVDKGTTYGSAMATRGWDYNTFPFNVEGYQSWDVSYSQINGVHLVKPFSEFSSAQDITSNWSNRVLDSRVINQDMDVYLPYDKIIAYEVNITAPVCGTAVSGAAPLTLADGAKGYSLDSAKWCAGSSSPSAWSGTVVGGGRYHIYVVTPLEFGYTYPKTGGTPIINGGHFETQWLVDNSYNGAYGRKVGLIVGVDAVHDPDDPVITDVHEPTCTEAGSHHELIKCKSEACGESIIFDDDVVDPAKGHTWDAGVVTKPATPTEAGEMICTCTVCGEKKTEVIPKSAKYANPLKIKAKTAKIKYKKLRKKAQKLAATKVIKFTNKGEGALKYKISSAKKGKKSFKKYFKISAKTGKITVKKKLKKGTYKVKIKVQAAGNASYEASAWQTVTSKIKVK